MNSYASTDCYCSVISIVFGFEFDFEFALEAVLVVGKNVSGWNSQERLDAEHFFILFVIVF